MLSGLNPRHLRHRQHIPLFQCAVFNVGHGLRRNVDLTGSHRPPMGDGLFRHVHHPGAALFIEMGQLSHASASDLIHSAGRPAGALRQAVPPWLLKNAPAKGVF